VRRSSRTGLPPGTVAYDGPEQNRTVALGLTRYHPGGFDESENVSLDEALRALRGAEAGRVVWVDVDGVHQPEIVKALGQALGWHILVQEDIVNLGQRPKLDVHGRYLAISLHATHLAESGSGVATFIERDQISLIVGEGYVVSFQETADDPFEPVRDRLRRAHGRFRERGADYLAYALMDVVVDGYFARLETVGDRIEALEEAVQTEPDPAHQALSVRLRRDLILLRRAAWPLREVISALQRSDTPLVDEETQPFLRDAYDHTVQVLDIVEALREVLSGANDLYLATVSHKMNEVMQVLTLVGTIFIPLTFIAGIYGMNFANMPELTWPYAYPVALGLMGAIAAALIVYFRRRGWL
jgi:magnesium transporter